MRPVARTRLSLSVVRQGRNGRRRVLAAIGVFALGAPSFVVVVVSCGGRLPTPDKGPPPPTSAYVEVPYAPPPGNIELVPERPQPGAVYVDGQWSGFARDLWSWDLGGWVVPPSGAKFTRWAVQRAADGRLYFAAPTWYGCDGGTLAEPPPFLARSRRGEPTGKARDDAGRDVSPGGDEQDAAATLARDRRELAPLFDAAALTAPTLPPPAAP